MKLTRLTGKMIIVVKDAEKLNIAIQDNGIVVKLHKEVISVEIRDFEDEWLLNKTGTSPRGGNEAEICCRNEYRNLPNFCIFAIFGTIMKWRFNYYFSKEFCHIPDCFGNWRMFMSMQIMIANAI